MRFIPFLLVSAACAPAEREPATPPATRTGDTDLVSTSATETGASAPTTSTGAPNDSGGPTDASDTSSPPVDLFGQPPPVPVPLPQFRALNDDGTSRGPDDLLGHPTVMWFFPHAGTDG